MRKLFILSSFLLSSALASQTVFGQTAKQIETNGRAIAKAEQSVAMATCKLDWLKTHVGVSRSSPAYFGFMAECLSKTASN